MIDKRTQRFIKEGLLALYREYPDAIEFPVYYLPFEHSTFKEIGMSIRSMHGIPEIPWPEPNCIICTEDHISRLLEHEIQTFILMLHTDKLKKRYNAYPKADDCGIIEPVEFFNVFTVPGNKTALQIQRKMITLVHREGVFQTAVTEPYLERKAQQFPGATPTQQEKLKSYWRAVNAATMEGIWVAKEMGLPNQDQMGLASDVLGYLSNIVVPCHYFVRSHFDEGFGTKAQKRVTRCKPIFSVISYDRLYRTFISEEHGEGDYEVQPHFRRGHVRHHWKRAGLNRLALPESPIERMKLVYKHHVARSYIPPMWVGESRFAVDGVTHEILTEEMPLVQIGNN